MHVYTIKIKLFAGVFINTYFVSRQVVCQIFAGEFQGCELRCSFVWRRKQCRRFCSKISVKVWHCVQSTGTRRTVVNIA